MTAAGPRALYLAVVQFVFVSTWTIYVAFLPELLAQAGIEKAWLPRLLLGDQLLMAAFDLAFGMAAARGLQRYGRIAPAVLAASLVSCLAFLLLPQLGGSPSLLLALTALWVLTSSALRAPLYALLSRHAATPEKARLAAAMTLGMAAAGMIAPWLGTQLKALSPALPFAVSSIALAALVLPLAAAERAAGLKTASGAEAAPAPPLPAVAFFALLLVAALGFQTFFNLAAAPAYLRHFSSTDLNWLMPMFWLGVAGGSVLASNVAPGHDPFRVFATGCLVATLAAAAFATLDGAAALPAALPAAQLAGGIGWGLALCKAFAIAERYAPAPGGAALVGALFSMLALATVARIGLNLAGMAPLASQWPLPLWLLAAVGVGLALLRSGARQSRQVG